MRTLRDSCVQCVAGAGVITSPETAVAPAAAGGAGDLTQPEDSYILWNSLLNLNVIAKRGITV